MDIRKLQRAIVDGLEDVKAQDIVVFNTEHLSPLFERVIIASGTSNRQTKALASSVRDAVKKGGMQVMRTEGEDNGEWIIVDCGAAVAHIMQPAIREYYHLEEIWGEKPVKIKLGADKGGLAKASEPMDADEDEAPARPAARKSATAKTPAGKVATQRATPAKKAAAKAPAKKTAARKTTATSAPAKAPTTRATPAKKAAPAKAPAKKAPAKKAPARPATARSTAAKTSAGGRAPATKAAAKKAPARKRAA